MLIRFLGASILALAIPVFTFAQNTPVSQSWEARSCADSWRPAEDSPDFWRWQAYHNLDCAMAMIDGHIAAPASGNGASEGDTVTISRDEMERLRRLILAGKDGAMRIGR